MTPHRRRIGKCTKVGGGLHATRGATRQKVHEMQKNTYFWICSLRVENWIWEVRKMKIFLFALQFWVDSCQLCTTGPIEQIVACVWSFVHFCVLKRWLNGIGWILDICWGWMRKYDWHSKIFDFMILSIFRRSNVFWPTTGWWVGQIFSILRRKMRNSKWFKELFISKLFIH